MVLENIIAQRKSKVIYRDNDKAVKVFDKEFSKADILNEALNQARIEETGLNTPKIIEVHTVGGKWAIVTEFIEGKSLEMLMNENPGKESEYLDLFVSLQMEIHSKKSPRLSSLKDKMNRKISASDLDATTRYTLHALLETMPAHFKVCHGDFNPGNIIVSENGEPYILDWSHASQGNASADVAISYLQFCLEGKNRAADKYLDLYCEKSNTAKQYIKKWIPLAAASQLIKKTKQQQDILSEFISISEEE